MWHKRADTKRSFDGAWHGYVKAKVNEVLHLVSPLASGTIDQVLTRKPPHRFGTRLSLLARGVSRTPLKLKVGIGVEIAVSTWYMFQSGRSVCLHLEVEPRIEFQDPRFVRLIT
jgi:hypothetical protein